MRDHRAHHRYVDTDKDPYSAAKGFWYAHIGWMLARDPARNEDRKTGHVDITDLVDEKTEEGKVNAPIVNFQNKYYLLLVLLTVRAGVQPKKPYHNVSHQTVYILAYALLKPILEYIKGSDAREIAQYKDIFDAMLDTVFRRNAPIQDRRRTVPEVSIPTIERRRKAMVPAA